MATLSNIIGFIPPNDRDYDSCDLSQTLLHGKACSRNQWFYYGSEKDGDWRGYSKKKKYGPAALFELSTDIGKRFNLADKYPEIIARINKIVNDQKYIYLLTLLNEKSKTY